nr:IQ motif, EF-hand binding site [Tanacetum cinerariifolium]
ILHVLSIMQAESSASENSAPELDEQIKELTSQLEQEKQARAEMEEENAKLRLFLKEITEYPVKEEGAADIETEKLPQPEDIPTTGDETIDKLTAENVRLKYMIGSLQRKCDERSEQTKAAESMVIELKTSKQSLEEQFDEILAECLMYRQQAVKKSASAASSPAKGQLNGSFNRLDSTSKEKQNENIDNLLAAVRQELGFSKGKPVATYIIYKSLLHWKAFEAEKTKVFDRLIDMIGYAIEKEHDNKHMAYWLSTTSTLLYLLQKSLTPVGHKPPPPSILARM